MQPAKKRIIVAGFILVLLLGTSVALLSHFNYFSANRANIITEAKNNCPGIKWLKPVDSTQLYMPVEITGDLYFAGEKVPLDDPDIKERLERELLINVNWRSNTLLCMKMANRYFGEIEKVLKEEGVPDDFKYLAMIESNFRLEASPAGAVGFWQMVKGTAKDYNLEVNDEVDERYNEEKETRAACSFLKDAKEKLGNWTLAAASYNMGVPSMIQRVKDQKINNYYEMYFNPETSRYIFRILAMKIIFADPKSAGYAVQPTDLYQPYNYKTVTVDTAITSVADFAAGFGLQYRHIKMLNPWLRDARLTNRDHKKYEIKILLNQ
ncbi:MAG TPA: lytic transglycosylase domain-containing protein [Chitinophagales bacterium]|nr:lytic transglycosylase domain-containing protein [Chitinophagales bacterium]